MGTDHFRYDLLVQDALRSMVRKVLEEVAQEGLPGDHHFLITFRTQAQGVRLSKRMRDRYPEEMTIVLQHQFWDLAVTEHTFEVGLSFGNVPERLLVPFESIVSFVDPSVQFGLKFEVQELGVEQGANDANPPVSGVKLDSPATSKPPAADSSSPVSMIPAAKATPKPAAKAATKLEAESAATVQAAKATSPSTTADKGEVRAETAEKAEPDAAETSKVVSIDAFRKKT